MNSTLFSLHSECKSRDIRQTSRREADLEKRSSNLMFLAFEIQSPSGVSPRGIERIFSRRWYRNYALYPTTVTYTSVPYPWPPEAGKFGIIQFRKKSASHSCGMILSFKEG